MDNFILHNSLKRQYVLTPPDIVIKELILNKKKTADKPKRPIKCCLGGCKKKLKLTDMICDCKNTYCSLHRLPHEHNCSYLKVKQQLNKEKILDGKCINDKVDKI